MQESQFKEKVEQTIKVVDDYYFLSFQLETEKAAVKASLVAEQVMFLLNDLQAYEVQKINEILLLLLEAMEKKDIVLVRDCLQYELKMFLQSLITPKNKTLH